MFDSSLTLATHSWRQSWAQCLREEIPFGCPTSIGVSACKTLCTETYFPSINYVYTPAWMWFERFPLLYWVESNTCLLNQISHFVRCCENVRITDNRVAQRINMFECLNGFASRTLRRSAGRVSSLQLTVIPNKNQHTKSTQYCNSDLRGAVVGKWSETRIHCRNCNSEFKNSQSARHPSVISSWSLWGHPIIQLTVNKLSNIWE